MFVGFISKGIDDARNVNLGIGALQRGYDYMIERASNTRCKELGFICPTGTDIGTNIK